MMAVLALLVVGLCEADVGSRDTAAVGRLGLGLGVREGDDGPVVACVIPGSAAAAADLAIGQRILRVRGDRVHTLRDLEEALTRAEPGAHLDLEIARDRPRLRIGLQAVGGLLARDADTKFALLGAYASLRALRSDFAWVISGGYVALGRRPGTGRNVLSLRAGVDGALPLVGPIDGFAAVLVGANVALTDNGFSERWPVAPVSVLGHVGLRWGILDVFAEAGLGPADGFGVSLGVTFALGLGHEEATGRGAVRLL